MGNVPAPNIIWRGAHPNNFTVGRPGGGRDGRESFHHVVGTAESAAVVFNQASRGASAHFIVTDQPGTVYQCVSIGDTAWCDANWESNLKTIAVEHHGDWRNGYDDSTVRENSAHLLAWLRENYGVTYAIRHRDVANTGTICPADFPVESVWARSDAIITSYNAPVDNRPQWLKDRMPLQKTVYAQKDNLYLLNLNDVNKIADDRRFPINQSFEIGSYTIIGGVKYLITISSTNANLAIGMRDTEVADTPYSPPLTPPPQPTTPDWADSLLVDDTNRTMYVLRATVLIDLENGRPVVKDGKEVWFQAGDIIEDISAHTIVSNITYQLTEYSFQQTIKGKYLAVNGIKSSDLTLDSKACPPGTPANPTPIPDPKNLPGDIPPTELVYPGWFMSFWERLIDSIRKILNIKE